MKLPLNNPSIWALVACGAAAVCEGIMPGTGIKSRFAELRLPNGAPPLWAWAIIGGAYYVLFFFLLKSNLAGPSISFWTSATLTLTAALLIANASWNWLFFRKKDLWLSFVFCVPYLLMAFALAGVLRHIRNPLSGWYALYLAYATWWGYRVWRLNPGNHKAEIVSDNSAQRVVITGPIPATLYTTRMGTVASATGLKR